MTTHLQLVVDLEPDTTPISGRLSSSSDQGRAFHGWLELASAIEALRNAAITAPESPRDDQSFKRPRAAKGSDEPAKKGDRS